MQGNNRGLESIAWLHVQHVWLASSILHKKRRGVHRRRRKGGSEQQFCWPRQTFKNDRKTKSM